MVTLDMLRVLALALPATGEEAHFDKTSFRVKGKIFVTCVPDESRITLKFTPEEQYIFSRIPGGLFWPVPNKWGQQGWTHGGLEKLEEDILREALATAYCNVAPAKLVEAVKAELTGEE